MRRLKFPTQRYILQTVFSKQKDLFLKTFCVFIAFHTLLAHNKRAPRYLRSAPLDVSCYAKNSYLLKNCFIFCFQ